MDSPSALTFGMAMGSLCSRFWHGLALRSQCWHGHGLPPLPLLAWTRPPLSLLEDRAERHLERSSQKQSEAFSGTWSGAIRNDKKHSEAISGNQRQSAAISGTWSGAELPSCLGSSGSRGSLIDQMVHVSTEAIEIQTADGASSLPASGAAR